jgi:flagellar hook capping protein FlgD
MRKTLFAMLGLVALGLWAMPTLAAVSNDPLRDPPKAHEPIAAENRAGIWQTRNAGGYQGTLSGTLIKQAQATTTWYLYPGACSERAAGTWVPRATPQADSLNTYTVGTTGPYGVFDGSLAEGLWHITDNALCTPGTDCPPALAGSRSIWCGKFDPNYAVKYGYPNITYQILYVDTGSHGANYTLTMTYQVSAEFNYDYLYIIGGGGGATDPIGNSRTALDGIMAVSGEAIRFTGSITPSTPNATSGNASTGTTLLISSNPGTGPVNTTGSWTMAAANRALYIVFKADCLYSGEDGLWPEGHGQVLDNISTSDNGAIYTDQAPSGGVDAFSGQVLVGTPGAPIVSSRVAPGIGTLWQLVGGNNLPTPDTCTPKNTSADKIFEGGNASNFHTVPNQFNSVVGCTFPIPAGVASVLAMWDEYLDLPRGQGYVQQSEFRIFKDGGWGGWDPTSPGGGVTTGARQSWGIDFDELGAATQADSVQIRYNLQCIPFFAFDHQTCGDVIYGILYDNFRLELLTGVPAPIFGVFVGAVGQSTFVDGTIAGTNCSAGQVTAGTCWPGVRGSNIAGGLNEGAVLDNFNSPLGDTITLAVVTGLRKNGKGINWHQAFDRLVNKGHTIAHTNPNFVAAFDAPRVIYRIFDPASKTWSPFDSSELDANAWSSAAGDTTMIDSEYQMNWPPRDKLAAGASLPGGFSVNTKTQYSQLTFLPRGSRLQYYFKGVDLNGGRSYQFSSDALARETEDLPTLPGSSIVAPDIIEFDVLPRTYSTAGSAGTLVAGKTDTPLLDLDGSYTRWNFGAHATVQLFKLMGVRADRYRTLQGAEEGGHIGGHEFVGTRAGRLSNYFPNMDEYGIKDLLAGWYRIMIESSHTATAPVNEEPDAAVLRGWWETTTGTDGGDRCIFASGDDYFNALLAPSAFHPFEQALATSVFGVAAAANQWNGGNSITFPLIKDLFADPAAGPNLGSGTYTYVIDGGCPAPNRFDALTKTGTSDTQNSATYPTFSGSTNVAAVSRMVEQEAGVVTPDHDRNKALGYGFSIQFIRQGGENFLDQRAQVLYKFLTSCRGPRTATDTASCWPCPTAANKYGNWATLGSSFNIATYGPLYAIQNGNLAAAGVGGGTAEAPALNRIQGNYPNPFNPQTAIRFTSARSGRVDVRIFDVAGRLVQTITKTATSGVNEVRWNGQSSDGKNLASGVYFVKVKYPDGSESLNGLKIAIVR